MSDHKTLLVALILVRNPKAFITSALDLTGKNTLLRNLIGRFFHLEKLALKSPMYGLAIELDFDGEIIRSWHDPEGKVIQSVTCVTQHNKKLYLGSYINDFIGVVDFE